MPRTDIETLVASADTHRREGRLPQACEVLEQAVALDAGHTSAWKMLGECHTSLGRLAQAAEAFGKAVALAPEDHDLRARYAQSLYQQGHHALAAEQFRQLALAQPDKVYYWYLLGVTSAALGRLEDAARAYQHALQLQPDHVDSLYGLGFVHYSRNEFPAAERCFRDLLTLNPGHAMAQNGLGSTLQALGRYQEAVAHYDRALALSPVYVDAHFGRGNTLIALGNTEGAIDSLREALRLNARHAGAWISLASALMTHGKADEALECCERALQILPGHPDASALAATIEQHAGRAEQGLQRLQPLIDRGTDNPNVVVAYAEVSKSLDRPEAAIGLLEKILTGPKPLPASSRRNLLFNLGRLYDRTGRYEQAFEQYRQGNALREMEYDPAANRREIDHIIASHTRAFLSSAPRANHPTDKPVFVVGMPRSGTSLVEQILASHPQVFGAGELPDLWQMVVRMPGELGTGTGYPGCLQALNQEAVNRFSRGYLDHLGALAPEARRVVDKMPGNFRFLGLIALLFPDARVIHCMRDPVDTCLSCYFQDFSRSHAYSYDLAMLAAYYQDYQRLMAHWRRVIDIPLLDVQYESLVEDQETVSRQLVEFAGLDWDESCLDFHNTRRFVATASYDQVRRPLYRKSVARWKHYEPWIGPLIEALK